MKEFDKVSAQGDMIIIRIDNLPDGIVEINGDKNGELVVAHSETGHHHVVKQEDATLYQAANDPMILFLAVNNDTSLRHLKSFDTHEPLFLKQGIYEIRRQRESSPEGWRRVAD